MGRVELAPSTMGDTGTTMATVGAAIAYYATIAVFDPDVSWLVWSRAIIAAYAVAAIIATAGVVLLAVERDRRARVGH